MNAKAMKIRVMLMPYVMMSTEHFGANVIMDLKVMAENVMTSMNVLNTRMNANSIRIAITMMAVTLVNVKIRV